MRQRTVGEEVRGEIPTARTETAYKAKWTDEVAALKQWVKTGLGAMRGQLLGGIYRHQGVRKKSIPKPNGDERILGIPTVIDRMVQQAVLQVFTPMLDPQMSGSSHGFRPGRKAHDALEAASRYVRGGCKVAVDLD